MLQLWFVKYDPVVKIVLGAAFSGGLTCLMLGKFSTGLLIILT